MSGITGWATFIGGAGLAGYAAYSFEQHGSGKLHDKQVGIDAAITESTGKPATIKRLQDDRPSDFSVRTDKSFILGGLGIAALGVGLVMGWAGAMSDIPENVSGTVPMLAVGLGLTGGAVAGVVNNTALHRFGS